MKKIIFIILTLLLFFKMGFSQYSGLSVSLDRTLFCSQLSTIKVTGRVTALSGGANGYHFVGMIFHFYYLNGSQQQIGTYTINTSSSFVVSSYNYSNQNPAYFDGNQISGGQVVSNTYSPGAPNNGGTFVMSFDLPYYAFPTSSGVQFYVAVEAIDQQGNRTAISSKVAFDDPILNPNPALSKPAVNATTTMLCGSDIATLSTNPDLSSTYNYQWYKDGNLYGSGSTVTTTSPGTYSAYIYDACQNVTTDPVVISAGQPPSAPTVSSSNGTLLCNGASTTLTATPTAGGVIHWNTGAIGNVINVSTAGTYYAYEENHCGISSSSNAITISVTNAPSAPTVSSSNGNILCNGAPATLSTSPTAGGVINWNTGGSGNSISVSAAGNYYATETNGCGTSINSNTISLVTNTTPPSPSVQSSNGTFLCNGASSTLSTTASGGGTIHWNTGATGNSITVNAQGNYFAYEINSCGTSPSSNSIPITTGTSPSTPSISSSNGTFICNGSSTVLTSSAPTAGGTIKWNTGQQGGSITVTNAGDYYAYEVATCTNSANSNTIRITTGSTPAAPTVSPTANQLLCNGASVQLSSTGANVKWSTGATGNSIVVNTAGNYYSVDQNACGNSSPSNTVVITTGNCPTPLPGGNFYICPGTLKTLDAGAGYDSYSWSNGATTQTISVGAGSYTVTVTKNGCSSTSSVVTVTYLNVTTPTITVLGSSTICASGSVTLKASSGVAYQWSHGSTAQFVSINTAGGYYVSVTDGNGCVATSAAVNITVNPLPTATISGGGTVCKNGASPMVTFTGSGGTAPYTFTYQINGGTNQTITTTSASSVNIPASATVAGSYSYSLVNVSDANCSNTASGSATVVVNDLPTATINGSTTVCQNASSPLITLTGIGGSAPYTFVYQINGGTNQTITTTSGSSVTVSVPTASAGSFTYSLVSVQNSSCSNTVSGSATVLVNALPSATISGGGAVCQNVNSAVIIFTGSGGVAPYTFGYKINGGSIQTITTNSGSSVALNVPTAVAGTFIYSLVNVQDGSSTACSNSANGSVTVTVNALPNATISGATSVCQNSPSPVISFTGSGGVAPYSFSYKINGGAVQTVSATGNTVSVNVPTSSAGSFTYSLVNVSDASCSNTASGSATVVVKTLPTATISGTATLCQNSPSPVITIEGNGGSSNYTFSYTINGGAVQTVTGSTASIPQSTASAGTFTYSLVSVSDGGCVNPVSGSATITINTQPQTAVITAPVQHLCNGDAAAITVTNYSAGSVYAWYKDGTFLRSSNADTIIVNQAGNYYVVPTAGNGCAAGANSDTIKITTGTIAAPVITGYLHVCPEGKTKLSAGGGFDKWRWKDMDDGRVVSEDSIFSAYAGQYHVEVEKGGCTDSANVVVKADDTEFPAGQLKIEPAHIAYSAQATLTAYVTNAVSYQWDLGNGNTVSGAANVVRENYYMAGDSIKIWVRAVSERNCVSMFSGYLQVDAMKKNTIADNSFTGNLKDWNVFPIPFRDHLKVSMILQREAPVRLDLFTIDGKWVRRWNYKAVKGENLFTLDDVAGLTPGVVYVITSFYNNQIHYEKFFKY